MKNISKKIAVYSLILIFFGIGISYLFFKTKGVEDTVYFISGYHKNLFGSDRKGFFNLANIIENKEYKVVDTNNSYKNLKNAKYIVVFDIHKKKIKKLKKLPKKKLILFTWEPKSVILENHDKKFHNLFSKVFTFDDDLIDNRNIFKFYYPDLKPIDKNIKNFNKKKLCCQISSNKTSTFKDELYSERIRATKYFEAYAEDEYDLFGRGWSKKDFKSYKGEIENKIEILKNYKFSICFENTKNTNGYITEKIFNSFEAGCIPIYLGANNIETYIPKNCFIDKRDFKSYNELFVFLKTMSEDEYDIYIKNIKKFLNSDRAKLFSGKNLILTFLKALDLEN